MTKRGEILEPKSFNNVYYGQSTIIAVEENKWVCPGGHTTTDRDIAMSWAIKANQLMGGKPRQSQMMSNRINAL